MKGQGFLLCNEINPKRAKILSRNVERMGIAHVLVTNEHPENLANRLEGYFDRVLVDAPCSGEGMFRKEEAAVTDWSEETVQMCARRQKEILESAARLVKEGGRLVYSTCTFAPEENEQVIAYFLENHPEFQPEEVSAPWFTKGEMGTFRLWPHKLLGEGHFAAVLKKTGHSRCAVAQEQPGKLPKVWQEFARQLEIALPAGKALQFGSSLYWAPEELPSLRGLKVLRPGLELGQEKKDRFEPAHALALWLEKAAVTEDLEPDGKLLQDYMNGQVIPSDKKGWCLVRAGNYSIGWGKGDGKVLKNHYPKGLRR